MKIGIMGGTFNPIHNAHLLIAEMAREEYGLDRVIFITDGNPPHKSANVTAKQRFEMTHIAIADNSAFDEDDFEISDSFSHASKKLLFTSVSRDSSLS